MMRAGYAAALLLLLGSANASAQGFHWRGVLEGFYGRPWTWQQRRGMVDWMAQRGDNLFVIAPKDDALLRKEWRQPLPADYLKQLAALQRRATANGVTLAWTLSPLGVKLRDPAELASAVAKYRQVLALGLRKLVIAFDDTEPRPRQIDFANAVLRGLISEFPDLEMTFIPAVYWSKAPPSPYFGLIAAELDPRFLVGWTGPGIISETITAEEGLRFRKDIRHKLVLGDNYPVQDRLLDSGPLYLGPLLGREPGLVDSQEAFISNASPLMEASKVPLQTAADFARDPARYDAQRSWEKALKDNHVPESLARECATSWISDPPPDWLYRNTLEAAIQRYWITSNPADLKRRLASSISDSPALANEVRPWQQKLSNLAGAALGALGGARKRPEEFGNPAVVGDFALDRFLLSNLAFHAGHPPPGGLSLAETLGAYAEDPGRAQAAQAALRLLSDSDAVIPAAAPHEWGGQLAPWFEVLAQTARRTLASLDGSRATNHILLPGPVWRWRMRLRFLPLMTSRALLENYFAITESAWSAAPTQVEPAGRWLGIWLWVEGFLKPSAFPVVLSRQLSRYRASGDGGELEATFRFLESFPALMRKQAGWRMTPEIEPWLAKVGLYGKLGRLSLSYEKRLRSGGEITSAEKTQWDFLRRRLASSNGLELCARLKYMLDDFVRWRRLPPQSRPARFKVDWPADPGQLL